MEGVSCPHYKETIYSAYLPTSEKIKCIHCGKEFSLKEREVRGEAC